MPAIKHKRLYFFLFFLCIPFYIYAVGEESGTAGLDEMLKKAQDHFYQGRYHVAMILLDRIKAADPENSTAYSLSGDIHLIHRELPEAEKDFHTAIELSERKDREYYRLGQVLYLSNRPREAMDAFEQALKINPNLKTAIFYKGLVQLFLLRNKEKTIEYWTEFRKIAPDDPQGPDIDRALAVLRRSDFVLPPPERDMNREARELCAPCCENSGGNGNNNSIRDPRNTNVPDPSDSRIPYMPAEPEKEKSKDEKESIIEKDDL